MKLLRKQKRIKLSLEKANEISTLSNSGYFTQIELAKKYRVNQATIFSIIHNKIWKN